MNSYAEHRLLEARRVEAPVVSRGALRRGSLEGPIVSSVGATYRNAVMGWGPIQLPPFLPKKPLSLGLNGSNLYWQEHHNRKKKGIPSNYPTTMPLEYDSRFRMGSLNVPGFADTLKLKNSIQMIREHNLGVLFLSETKSTSYYSYTSEGHLVVLSGNRKDKHAGVGVIIAPKYRPYLVDIIQISPRIIHITFKKKEGNVHLIGTYAPHSGHDLVGPD